MHTPEPSQVVQRLSVSAAQQLPWQSPELHSALPPQAAPVALSVHWPDTAVYGALQAVQAPVPSQAVQTELWPVTQQLPWQSPLAHAESAVHAVPAGARQLPALTV